MTAPSAATAYLEGVGALLGRVRTDQEEQIEQAADLMAEAIRGGGLVHIFGSGHSMLPALEIFPRYGSFVGLHPIVDPRLLWFNVLGSFGVPEMLFLQNTEGYADVLLDGQHLRAGDVLLVFSHGGTSAVVVDAARYARDAGLTVVEVSSSETAGARARHSSGKKLTDLVDLTIDTHAPRGEAAGRRRWAGRAEFAPPPGSAGVTGLLLPLYRPHPSPLSPGDPCRSISPARCSRRTSGASSPTARRGSGRKASRCSSPTRTRCRTVR